MAADLIISKGSGRGSNGRMRRRKQSDISESRHRNNDLGSERVAAPAVSSEVEGDGGGQDSVKEECSHEDPNVARSYKLIGSEQHKDNKEDSEQPLCEDGGKQSNRGYAKTFLHSNVATAQSISLNVTPL